MDEFKIESEYMKDLIGNVLGAYLGKIIRNKFNSSGNADLKINELNMKIIDGTLYTHLNADAELPIPRNNFKKLVGISWFFGFIKESILRNDTLISKVESTIKNTILNKFGYNVNLKLYGLKLSNSDGITYAHPNFDADLPNEELTKLLSDYGLL